MAIRETPCACHVRDEFGYVEDHHLAPVNFGVAAARKSAQVDGDEATRRFNFPVGSSGGNSVPGGRD
ncbi:MAG: hypothetical protein ACLQOO_15770 [Terriglobia bacterium]